MSAGCATAGDFANYILFPLGTSFVTVADFTTGVDYAEGGYGGGTSLGTPTSGVVSGSIVTVFPPTADGLLVTQNMTVTGSTPSDSAILMSVKVVNTNAGPQEVGVRYLWDLDVGGYDGAWLQEHHGMTAGAITGYETSFSPPPQNFTSYAVGGCSQGSVVPPPYICEPSNFGADSGTFAVSGSISSGPGVTTPARFVYGLWRAMSGTTYGYVSNPSNEVGSYVQSVGGGQDSALLYYFSNQTLAGTGGALSDQADVNNSPSLSPPAIFLTPSLGAVGTSVTVTGAGLTPLANVTLVSFGSFGPVPLSGTCATNPSGYLTSSGSCAFTVPASASAGVYTLTFSDGTHDHTATFTVTPLGVKLTCSPSPIVVGTATTCEAAVQGGGLAPTGPVAWSSNTPGEFSSTSCRLSSGACSVKFTPIAAGSAVILTANYAGDSRDPASAGTYSLVVTFKTSTTTVSCTPSSVLAASPRIVTCTARVSGYLPTGTLSWSQSGTGTVSFVAASCTLSKATLWYYSFSGGLTLHKLVLGICSVTLTGAQAGSVAVQASYGGNSGNTPSSGSYGLKVGKVSTSVAISCSSTTLNVGAPVTCTAVVQGGYLSQTGTVTWSKASGSGKVTFSPMTCTLSAGSCSVTVTATAAGSVKIKAAYGGDSNNLRSSATVVLTAT